MRSILISFKRQRLDKRISLKETIKMEPIEYFLFRLRNHRISKLKGKSHLPTKLHITLNDTYIVSCPCAFSARHNKFTDKNVFLPYFTTCI